MSGLASRAWRLGDRDWTRGHGIPFDRTAGPADDETTDVAAWLAGRFDTLAADEFELDGDSNQSTDSHGRGASHAGIDVHSWRGVDPREGQGRSGSTHNGSEPLAQQVGVDSARGADSSAWHPNLTGGFDTRLNATGTARAASTVELGERSQPTEDET